MMKKFDKIADFLVLITPDDGFPKPSLRSNYFRGAAIAVAFLIAGFIPPAKSQQTSQQVSSEITIHGVVRTSEGKPVNDAAVQLAQPNVSPASIPKIAKTGTDGTFEFSALNVGKYQITAEKSGLGITTPVAIELLQGEHKEIDLVIADNGSKHQDSSATSASASQPMEFADKPDFTVAGVTDWTAAGGHGSDLSLRTTEDLTRETLSLEQRSPGQVSPSNSALVAGDQGVSNRKSADAHRQAAELAEKRGDPLAAVNEYELAVRVDPSEQNYFAWGSELLLHRAIWQAQEVFQTGATAYPMSARMLTGLGTALFAGARYDDAALRLCDASALNPADPEPYIFMGKIQLASPNPLNCIEQKLAQFARQQPDNSTANYLYAMAILKRGEQSNDSHATQQAESLLTRAVTIDPKCGEAYLQLGILSYAQRDVQKAIGLYIKAVEADPQMGDAHYRLGVAYDRIGETAKAKQQFQIHDEIKKQQADAIERERREIKQFRVVIPAQPIRPDGH
jgi:tetratricopeptide (TPR) repeat protein